MPEYAIIQNVSPKEFRHLKNQESRLIEKVYDPDVWSHYDAPAIKSIKTILKYNPDRKMVGIYVEENGQYHLVDKNSDARLINYFAGYYQDILKKELTLMIPKENWVDEI